MYLLFLIVAITHKGIKKVGGRLEEEY